MKSRESMEEYAEAMQEKACAAHEKHSFHDAIADPEYDQENPFPRVSPSRHGKGFTSYP